MLNAKITRALLSILVLGSVPAMAAIPPEVEFKLEGGALVDWNQYEVHAGEQVSLSAVAAPGDALRIFASPIRGDGSVDWVTQIDLLADKSSKTGELAASFEVPKELDGQSFMLLAIAMNRRGETGHSNYIRIDVKASDK